MSWKCMLKDVIEHCDSIPNLYFGTFYQDPSHTIKVLYLSNESTHGNAHGKVKITGKTWKEIYNKISTMSIDLAQMETLPWVE